MNDDRELAYHWLKADMRAGNGRERPWKLNEERTHKAKTLIICKRGYHSSPTPWDGLPYAPGPVLSLVEISGIAATQADKKVSRTRKLLAFINVENELRQFAIDCATRALERERAAGREPDERSWAAVRAAQAFLRGEITPEQLAAARDAAWDAAWDAARDAAAGAAARDAARDAAWVAAWVAAGDAAWVAAWDAARDAAARDAAWVGEVEWQKQRFNELVLPRIEAAKKAIGGS